MSDLRRRDGASMTGRRRAVGLTGAYGIGATTTWNLTNVGGAPELVASHFQVGLGAVGLLTSALFLAQTLVQIPGGRGIDRLGPRTLGLLALAVVVGANAALLAAPSFQAAVALRFVVGLGGGVAFIAGVTYVRALGGTALAQGLYGGAAIAGAGLSVSAVASLSQELGWQAPFVSAAVVNGVGFLMLLVSPAPDSADAGPRRGGVVRSVVRDVRVWRFAALQAATFGVSIVLGNWIVLLLTRNGGYPHELAGLVGGLVLLGGVIGRPLGGWYAAARPDLRRPLAVGSLVAASAGTLLLVAPHPLAVAVVASCIIGVATGVPFASVFDGVTRTRPDAPGVATAVMNAPTMMTIMIGTPLFGATFSIVGEGRLGLLVVAGLILVTPRFALPGRDDFVPRDRP